MVDCLPLLLRFNLGGQHGGNGLGGRPRFNELVVLEGASCRAIRGCFCPLPAPFSVTLGCREPGTVATQATHPGGEGGLTTVTGGGKSAIGCISPVTDLEDGTHDPITGPQGALGQRTRTPAPFHGPSAALSTSTPGRTWLPDGASQLRLQGPEGRMAAWAWLFHGLCPS